MSASLAGNRMDALGPYDDPEFAPEPLPLGRERSRSAAAWVLRYTLVGAGIGLVMPFFTGGTLPFLIWSPVLGALAGAICGGLGAAVQGWVRSRNNPKPAIKFTPGDAGSQVDRRSR